MIFIDETWVRISSDRIVRVFRKCSSFSKKKFLEKKKQKLIYVRTNDYLCFGGAIRSDGRKLFFTCPDEMTEKKMRLLEITFQQDNAAVHKSNIIGNFYQENESKFESY